MSKYFQPIWGYGSLTLADVAAFSDELTPCPSPLLGRINADYVKFEIPSFQRGIRWSHKKREEFLGSLTYGWPTGVLVLTRTNQVEMGQGSSEITWQVLDGQQRISTFKNLREAFWSAPWYQYSPKMQEAVKIISQLLDKTIDDITAAIHLMTRGDEDNPFDIKHLDESSKFLSHVCNILGVAKPSENEKSYSALESAAKEIRTGFLSQKQELDEIPIAIVTVTPASGLSQSESRATNAQIFSVLNSGVKLSKYELLTATWSGLFVPWKKFVDSNEPVQGRGERVKKLQKELMREFINTRISESWEKNFEDMESVISIEDISDEEISLYDFLYGLSKATRVNRVSQAQSAFRTSFPSSIDETVAFDTSALLFSGSLDHNSILNLQWLFPQESANYDISLFADHYLHGAKVIDNVLSIFSIPSARAERTNPSLGAVQAKVYLAAFINNVMKVDIGSDNVLTIKSRSGESLRTIDGSQIVTQPQRINHFKAALPSWWLADILNDEFQGSDAYQNAKNRVWTNFEISDLGGVRKAKTATENDSMLFQPSLLSIVRNFVKVFVEESDVKQAPVNRIRTQSATAVLVAAYYDVFAAIPLPIEMDHVVAFKANRQTGERLTAPIPLNHAANWMPLNKTVNGGRGNQHWSTFFNTLTASNQSKIASNLLIESSELDGTLLTSKAKFLRVMLVRWVGMTDKALRNVLMNEYEEMTLADRKDFLTTHLISPILDSLEINSNADEIWQSVKLKS